MEPCGYGGIGRRSGLRIRCLRRGGSSPFSRTRPSAGGIRSETVVVPRIVRKVGRKRKVSRRESESLRRYYFFSRRGRKMKLAAFVFCLISTIAMGWCLIPLAWCIPMTVAVYNAYKYNKPLSVGFKVCTLIFVSLIGGILLLCDSENGQADSNNNNNNNNN